MKIAIVGSRGFSDLSRVQALVRKLPVGTVIVSGGARGVDQAAEYAALERGLGMEIYPADWDKFGKRAGFIRNQDIVKAADRVVAFWDGRSRGTKHSIDLARELRKPVEIYLQEPELFGDQR